MRKDFRGHILPLRKRLNVRQLKKRVEKIALKKEQVKVLVDEK